MALREIARMIKYIVVYEIKAKVKSLFVYKHEIAMPTGGTGHLQSVIVSVLQTWFRESFEDVFALRHVG